MPYRNMNTMEILPLENIDEDAKKLKLCKDLTLLWNEIKLDDLEAPSKDNI